MVTQKCKTTVYNKCFLSLPERKPLLSFKSHINMGFLRDRKGLFAIKRAVMLSQNRKIHKVSSSRVLTITIGLEIH